MVEDAIEQLSIYTYLKKDLKIKKNVPARTIKFSKKDDERMIFLKAPNTVHF